MTIVLDGKKLSLESEKDFSSRVKKIHLNTNSIPILATILVGNDPASNTYVKMKGNACKRIGMDSLKIELEEKTTTDELREKIIELNNNDDVHGILLQHPVPDHIDERSCFDAIDIRKDVDGVTSLGFGRMSMQERAFGSCTPFGIMRLLKEYKIDIEGKSAVVVGRSPILGKPMAMMLLNENATVTICHSKTQKLSEKVSEADIIVGAVGIPKFIKGEWIKDGAVVIDAGYHPEKCGDIDLENIIPRCSAYTPVPGGVGPMTINTLIMQTLQSCENYLELD
ncbi:MAG: bifunctional 5,10-methylene-tetrahydrofolate dehydrogenase/5,10-methylene-tetrahydrofolate cyclohydrolase [Gammaproteobacteria bacterium TMED159]|nr:MAG: bifunctional 5,10-methylene-tetrahydrofolate dehydrogenase/5,10-methylene-tetrahydrofolate cyclohydrolase [Gammaproteobacteria bacterium TMED159]OUW08020.1 MAG: bifunctional 5,10-methylene-tetrahydrofolate dehydrogenase/5,10-methylene-tetrahydrofolate cyclohydrolase [Gammaproteobacteria bacterium TMED159]RCL40906.1 MAG: bifunctional methylenetetrahydrofolate dehydrogenase/methenyltetrahydrofolate cyclohydrolase FolD [Gammaproteobacteria bacterium]